ncbi:hypothetical protein FQZ97_813740 [compost metagenome]
MLLAMKVLARVLAMPAASSGSGLSTRSSTRRELRMGSTEIACSNCATVPDRLSVRRSACDGVNSVRRLPINFRARPQALSTGSLPVGAAASFAPVSAASSGGGADVPGLYRPISSITRSARLRLLSNSICVRSCS